MRHIKNQGLRCAIESLPVCWSAGDLRRTSLDRLKIMIVSIQIIHYHRNVLDKVKKGSYQK